MTVYEVSETFPTIFFMQNIKQIFEVSIDCVRSQYYRLKTCIEEHKEAKNELVRCLRRNEDRLAKEAALGKLYQLLYDELNNTVRGGINSPIGLFFPVNGYQVLKEDNPSYYDLLKFIKSVEKFLIVLMDGL